MKKILFFLLISISGFSQVKISDMTAATSLTGTELVPIVQSGVNKKATPLLWQTYLSPIFQTTLVSGTNIKTVNGNSLLGSGDISIGGFTVASLAEAQAGTDNTKGMTPLRVADVTERRYNVKSYGAKGDGQVIFANITATQNTITAGSSVFVAGDVGKLIKIAGGGAANAPITTTITGYTSGTQVTIGTTITTSQTNAQIVWGTDDTAAIQAAFNAAWDANSGIVWVPIGLYLINGALQTSVFGANPNSQLYFKTSANTSDIRPNVKVVGEASASYAIRQYKGNATFFSLLTTGISGTAPAVIGSGATVSAPIDFNYSDITIEDLGILCFTNVYDTNYTANNPAYLSGINFLNIAKWKLINVMIGANQENSAQPSASPVGTNNFGFAGGRDYDNGTNYFIDCGVWGFEHGAVLGDHTICDGSMIFNTVNGIVPINLTHQVNGQNVTIHSTKNAVYFPPSPFLGVTMGVSTLRSVDLKLAYEFNSGTWNNAEYILHDAGGGSGPVGVGQITYSLFGTSIAASELLYYTPANFPKLTLKYIGTTLPKVVSTGGSTGYNDVKAFTAAGYVAGQSIIESGGATQQGRVVISSNQAGGGNYIGNFSAVNGSTSSLLWANSVKTGAAANTGETEEYLMNAGSLTLVGHNKIAERAFLQPLVVGSLGGITNSSSLLDLQSTTRALVLPRVTNTASVATPVNGMQIYDVALNKFRSYENGAWTNTIGGGGSTYYAPTTLVANATDADFTATVNGVHNILDGVASANRVITIPTGANGDVMKFYNTEDTRVWSFTGATVYLADRVTVVTQLLFNVPCHMEKIDGLWIITN